MINIAKLSERMEALLNNNTLETKFRTFYWIENLDRTFEKVVNDNEKFIPSVIVSQTGQYRPIPDLLISDQSFILQIYFPQSRQAEILSCIEQFSLQLIGKTVNIDGKTVVFNVDVPNLSEVKKENIQVLNQYDPRLSLYETEEYGVVQIRVYFVESNLMYGNQVRYFLRQRSSGSYEELKKYDSASANNKVTATEHLLTNQTAESVAQMNSFTNNITFYFEPTSTLHLNIIRNAELGINQNQVYFLRIDYGNLSFLSFEKEVIIESVTINQSLGNVVMLSVNFKKASVIL